MIGRKKELAILANAYAGQKPELIAVFGRRRVGKTELLEQAFIERNVLKFEGIEGLREQEQMTLMLVTARSRGSV